MQTTKQFCPECGVEIPAAASRGCPNCLLRLAIPSGSDSQQPRPPDLKSRFFSDYEIIKEIARGGMGVVYKARQLSLGRLVALKMIQAGHLLSPEARLRFRMEVEAVAQLHHPHIVSLYESGEYEGTHFFTMRLVEGSNLAQWLRQEDRASRVENGDQQSRARSSILHALSSDARQFVRLLIKVCRAVHYAHQRGILHRDLKPSNILIDAQGEPHVVDFGLAKSLAQESGFTFTESILGSPNYMAPEQAAGRSSQLTTAADVYGLGAILYEALAARPPFQAGNPIETIRQVVDDEPAPPRKLNPSADADLETVCLKCLQKNPGARYNSAEELAEDLERWLDGRAIRARPVGHLEQIWRWSKRHPATALLGLALLLALASIVVGTSVAAVRINRAERTARAHLREALLAQVQQLRLSAEMGHRTQGLQLLREAAALGGPFDFRQRARDELLAALARTDMQFIAQSQLHSSPDPSLNLFDRRFERYASVIAGTNIVLRHVADGRELRRFVVGTSPVKQLAEFSHDGRFLAVRHVDGLSFWDVEHGERLFATNGPRRAFCFAPDQPVLVLEEWQCQLSFLELPALREIRRLQAEPDKSSNRAGGWSVLALAPGGSTLAAARARERVVELFSAETGDLIRHITNNALVTALAWNTEADRLAIGLANGNLTVWEPMRGLKPWYSSFSAAARSLAFNPAGTLLAAVCEDRFLRLIDLTALRQAAQTLCDSERLFFDERGSRLGSIFFGGQPGWFELTRPSEFNEFTLSNTSTELEGCRFSPDGQIIVCGRSSDLLFFDIAHGERLRKMTGWRIGPFCFDPRGEMMLAASTLGMFRWTTRWPDTSTLEFSNQERRNPNRGWRALGFSADGRWFATANVHSNAAYVFDRTLTNLLATVGPHTGADAVALSPDGRWLATGSSADRQVKVWNVKTGSERLPLAVGPTPRALFSPDGRWLVTYGDSFEVRQVGSWKPMPLPFSGNRPVLGAAAISRDGRMLAVVSDIFEIHLFDLVTLQSLGLLRPPGNIPIRGIDFSPDGTRLAAACTHARLRVWDLRRVRERLKEFGLDWDLPPLPRSESTNSEPRRVTFLQ